MTVTITACHKDSSGGYSKTFRFESKEQFLEQCKEFAQEVPFSRWYSEVVADDLETEELVESWLEESA